MGCNGQYDALGRRVHQTTSLWTNNAWRVIEDLKFVNDPMLFGRHIAELNATNNFLVRTYVWGIDLSGTIDGAGGVGGLLWVNQHSGSSAGAHFCAYDGNGNVVALISANTGTETARYEYGPFGEPIRITGPMSKENPFRFSTKRTCNITDLVLYEYRVYSPVAGRWLSKDRIGELGGVNVYGFVRNDTVNFLDYFGLEWIINRYGAPRAIAYTCEDNDTWDALARKVHMDTLDYQEWVQTTDAKPVPGKIYTIPNTIHIDSGVTTFWDQLPHTVFGMWRSMARRAKAEWEQKGYLVLWDEGVTDNDITTHLGSPNIYGYVYIGHGWKGAIINTYSHVGVEQGVGPDRYTKHGIAFMYLNSCYSADKVPITRHNYRYNAWESNVATRGWFKGYTGSVNAINELFQWAITRGKNDHPFKL